MPHFCLCSEELNLTSARAEGPSEGKFITTKHCKQRHAGAGGDLGAHEDYRLSSNTSWEKTEEARQEKCCCWVTLGRKTERGQY